MGRLFPVMKLTWRRGGSIIQNKESFIKALLKSAILFIVSEKALFASPRIAQHRDSERSYVLSRSLCSKRVKSITRRLRVRLWPRTQCCGAVCHVKEMIDEVKKMAEELFTCQECDVEIPAGATLSPNYEVMLE